MLFVTFLVAVAWVVFAYFPYTTQYKYNELCRRLGVKCEGQNLAPQVTSADGGVISKINHVMKNYLNSNQGHLFGRTTSKTVKTIVVLLAYYRSGSTFTGEFFNQHPQVFYLFEPLLPIVKGYNHTRTTRESANIRKALENIFLCRLESPLPNFHLNVNFLRRSRAVSNRKGCSYVRYIRKVFRCLGAQPGKFPRNSRNQGTITLPDVCAQYKVLASKLIRADVCDVLPFMNKYPHYKVNIIHLIRDPRGMLRSQQNIIKKENLTSIPFDVGRQARDICARMFKNMADGEQMIRRFGDVFRTFRYEDIAADPESFIKQMMEWVGLPLVPEVIKQEKLSAGLISPYRKPKREEIYGVYRKNGTATALAWQNSAKDFIQTVESACMDFLHVAKYPVQNCDNSPDCQNPYLYTNYDSDMDVNEEGS